MMNMDSARRHQQGKIKDQTPDIIVESAPEKKKDSAWDKFKLGFSKYLTKMFTEYGVLESSKPLSSMVHQKKEIESNRRDSKMISNERGGPTQDDIYASALKVAKQFGWQETRSEEKGRVFEMGNDSIVGPDGEISKKNEDVTEEIKVKDSTVFESLKSGVPTFLTKKIEAEMRSAGITEDEIYKLPIGKLWDLFQQKTLEKEIKEPIKEKVYTLDAMSEDFSTLQNMWEEAYDKMDNVVDSKRTIEITDLTAKTIDDPQPLEEYLKNNTDLEPEVQFFIEISIQIKKFRAKGKELLGR